MNLRNLWVQVARGARNTNTGSMGSGLVRSGPPDIHQQQQTMTDGDQRVLGWAGHFETPAHWNQIHNGKPQRTPGSGGQSPQPTFCKCARISGWWYPFSAFLDSLETREPQLYNDEESAANGVNPIMLIDRFIERTRKQFKPQPPSLRIHRFTCSGWLRSLRALHNWRAGLSAFQRPHERRKQTSPTRDMGTRVLKNWFSGEKIDLPSRALPQINRFFQKRFSHRGKSIDFLKTDFLVLENQSIFSNPIFSS